MRRTQPQRRFFVVAFLVTGCLFVLAGCSSDPIVPVDEDGSEPAETIGWKAPAAAEFSKGKLGRPDFVDVTSQSGVNFLHTDGEANERYIHRTVVSGVALLDYDNDGLLDIYFVNGAPNPGASFDHPPRNALYRNLGGLRFVDVTQEAGVGDTGYGLGVTVGDYDNDGDADIYVSNFGPNVLYRNNGDKTFTNATAEAGVESKYFGAGVAFLDIEGDGDLDLFVSNYVQFNVEMYAPRKVGDHEFSEVPRAYEPEYDQLFRNNGDGSFTDISQLSGVREYRCRAMGLVCFDYDDDGDTDIFIANDTGPNCLLRNDGSGHFEEVGLIAGVAHDLEGNDNGSMGVACGDYDNDGRLDLYVTNYQAEYSVLYRNVGDGLFADVSRKTRAGAAAFAHVKWGVALADFDHDADRDLFVASGHFMKYIRHIDDRTGLKTPNAYLENREGVFHDVSKTSGTGMSVLASSKGAAFNDLDNDGDLDAVILNVNDLPTILRNDLNAKLGSVQILLRGKTSNRDGVGSRVKVVANGKSQIAEVHAGDSYQSYSGSRLHFGLGDAEQIDRIEVSWLGGEREIYEDIPKARILVLHQGGNVEVLPAAPH